MSKKETKTEENRITTEKVTENLSDGSLESLSEETVPCEEPQASAVPEEFSKSVETAEPDQVPAPDDADVENSAEALCEEALNELNDDKEAVSSSEQLIAEIHKLKDRINELERMKETQSRMLIEVGDFAALFPDVPVESIPEEVWDNVKKGTCLAASYALYEKRMLAESKRIAEINAKNARRSPGIAGKDTADEYFSPDDVRRMSRSEVHANYSKIKESMKKWM